MPFLVRVEGADEAVADMAAAAKVDLRNALRQAASIVAREAQARTHSRRVKAAMTYDVTSLGPMQLRASIGPLRRKAFFAHFLEFGTNPSAKRPWSTAPQPFLIPAAHASEQRVIDLVGNAVMTLPAIKGRVRRSRVR